MKKRLVVLALSAGTFIGMFSCSHDDDFTANEQRLARKEWKIVDISRKSLLNPNQDSSILKSCSADDRLHFSLGWNFEFKDNAPACDSSIFQYDKGAWYLTDNEKKLMIIGSKRTQVWEVLLLNDTSLKVNWLDSTAADKKVLKTMSFKNK